MVLHNPVTERMTPLPTFTYSEMRSVNKLIQSALLSVQLERRLVNNDATLKKEFNIPDAVWQVLSQIKVSTLSDFCGEITRLQRQDTANEHIS